MYWALGLGVACYKGIVQPMLITHSGSAVTHNTHDCFRPINLGLMFYTRLSLYLTLPSSLSIRREQGVSGQPSSIMVEGVQVTLPSYEEAVYGSGGPCGASGPPPSPPPPLAPPESRVPIVLSEGLPQGATGGQAPSRNRHHRDLDFCLPSTSSSSSFSSRRHAETVLVHQAPSSSSSSSSSWAREHPGGACAGPLPLRRDSESSDQHSLLSVASTDDFSDGKWTQTMSFHTFSF